MKRNHSPPPLAVGVQDILDFVLSPPKSRNQELDNTIDWILSQPSPPGGRITSPPLQKPTEETVQDLLDWLDSLWVPEAETKQEMPGGDRIIPRPFPWATDDRSTRLHSLEYILYTLRIDTVSADFKCKLCGDVERIGYNLAQKYTQISLYIARKGPSMGRVAPNSWLFPTRPQCKNCNNKRRSLGQVITEKESSINWLFLLMGKLIGCCKVHQLRDFCKQNQIECNGKKPRLVYLTYLGLCKQLDPRGNYDL